MEFFKTLFKYRIHSPYLWLVTFISIVGCTDSPPFEDDVSEFILKPGYKISTIAAEPLLQSPVALSFDPLGQIWAVELTGYMRDIDGANENYADGKIVMLTDDNRDGVMDKRHVMLDSLEAPRALLHVYGGLLYTDGTQLKFISFDDRGDIVEEQIVDSLYVVGGNIEHQPNSLTYHHNNWIYSANLTARYRRINGEWVKEVTAFRGQWGLTFDQRGRFYYNNNSLPLATDLVMPNTLDNNIYQEVMHNQNLSIATNKRIYPLQATSVNRGYIDGVLDDAGRVKEFTSACAPLIFTGDKLGPQGVDNAFVCAPEANLIKRYEVVTKQGQLIAMPMYDSTEFLISKDETFRPVNLYNGHDGSLLILDMRKGVIQHRAYMTNYLREKIIEKGLDKVYGKGRIYRVTKNNELSKFLSRSSLPEGRELVDLLKSPLHQERLYAQQQLIFNGRKDLTSDILSVALDESNSYGQLHAFWTLEGLNVLDDKKWRDIAFKAGDQVIQESLLQVANKYITEKSELLEYCLSMSKTGSVDVIIQVARILGRLNDDEADAELLILMKQYGANQRISEALVNAVPGKEVTFYNALTDLKASTFIKELLKKVIVNRTEGKVKGPSLITQPFKDNRTAGFDLYNIHCSSCHGLDGIGLTNLAPPLVDSEYVSGSKDRLILLTLHGLKGPVTVNGKRYEMNAVMPGLSNNTSLSDQDIADILIFLRNSFSFSDPRITADEVKTWRMKTAGRTDLFTEEELSIYE